jgi:hypothetical protein
VQAEISSACPRQLDMQSKKGTVWWSNSVV